MLSGVRKGGAGTEVQAAHILPRKMCQPGRRNSVCGGAEAGKNQGGERQGGLREQKLE